MGLVGYIANTDFDWYCFLAAQPFLDEVNFWQPSGTREFRRVSASAPFFFKLKKPYFAIAGFGYFARSSRLPAWLASESFGPKNGAPDFGTMRTRIEKYLPDRSTNRHGEYTVGCLMIEQDSDFRELLRKKVQEAIAQMEQLSRT